MGTDNDKLFRLILSLGVQERLEFFQLLDTFRTHAETFEMVLSKDSFEIPEGRLAEAAYIEQYCLISFENQTLAKDLEALHRLLFPPGKDKLPILEIQHYDWQTKLPFPAHRHRSYQEQADSHAPAGDPVRPLAGNRTFPRGGNEVLPPVANEMFPRTGNDAVPPASNNSATPAGNNSAAPAGNSSAAPTGNNSAAPAGNISPATASVPSHVPGGHPSDELDEDLPLVQDDEQHPHLTEENLHEHDNAPEPDGQQADDPEYSLKAMLEVRDRSTWGMIGNVQQFKQVFSEYCRVNDERAKNNKSQREVLDDARSKALVEDLCRAMVDMTNIVDRPDSVNVKKVQKTPNLEIELLAWMLLERCVDASAGELKIPRWTGKWAYNKDHHTFESRFAAVQKTCLLSKAAVVSLMDVDYQGRLCANPEAELKRKMINKNQNEQKNKWVKDGRSLERVGVPTDNDKDSATKSSTDENAVDSAPAQEDEQANGDVQDNIAVSVPGPSNASPSKKRPRVESPESYVVTRK